MRVEHLSTLALLSVPILLITGSPADANGGSGSDLVVPDRISLAGGGDLTVEGGGAVHYHGAELPDEITLRAERITVEYAWEEGWAAGPPGYGNLSEMNSDEGRAVDQFRNVTLTAKPFEGEPELLAYPGDAEPSVEVSGVGDQGYTLYDGRYVTRTGVQTDGESTNDSRRIGFWYEPAPDWSAGYRNDEARLTDDFSLFLNNLTVSIKEGDEPVWENWTGYRQEDTGPAASSFERHLLHVHVTNGTFSLAGEDAVTVLGGVLNVDANGILTAQAATGRLQLDSSTLVFDDEPIRMEGEGSLRVAEASAGTLEGLSLAVDADSEFDVHGGQRMDGGPMASEDVAGWGVWLPASLVGLLIAGAVAHRAGLAGEALQRWRTARYTKWMTRGRELANARDYGQAAACFRRATRAQPAKGIAWYHLAIALLEDRRPPEVLEVVEEARRGEAIIDDLDFFEVEAQAALWADDRERCRRAIEELAEESPQMATSFVHDLQLGEKELGPDLAGRLSTSDDEDEKGGLPGYV